MMKTFLIILLIWNILGVKCIGNEPTTTEPSTQTTKPPSKPPSKPTSKTPSEPKDQVKYFTHLIKDGVEKAKKYKPPVDASHFKPDDDNFDNDFGTYDFIVVGAGSSGTVVANRLSEMPNWKILLIEAGKFANNLTTVPAMNVVNMMSEQDWGYKTLPQKTACLGMKDQMCPMPRGRGVGGTSLINALSYARGNKYDYIQWQEMGSYRWVYKSVLPYFLKSENFVRNDPEAPVDPAYHGLGGYLSVDYHLPRSKHFNVFLKANEEMGYNLTDCNGPHQVGAGPHQFNTMQGRRLDGGTAFIKPFLNRPNLKVMTESYVTKILIDEKTKKAIGVTFAHEGKGYTVKVRGEVILSAGAVATPQLLQLSGIGPKEHLEKLGIPVISDLQVGSNLRDQIKLGLTFSSNLKAPDPDLKNQVMQFLKGTGPLTLSLNVEGAGFYQTKIEAEREKWRQHKAGTFPDLEIMFNSPRVTTWGLPRNDLNWNKETYEAISKNKDPKSTFIFYIIALHTQSTGTVRLNSKNPYDYPLIDLNLLSDPKNEDIDTIYEGIQLALNLTKTKAFQKIKAKLSYNPLPACKKFKSLSKDYWYCAIRQLTHDVCHPIGTSLMGRFPEYGAVIDQELKVLGVRNLRVADASAIPFTFSGHPNAVCVMIGEMCSELLKRRFIGRSYKMLPEIDL